MRNITGSKNPRWNNGKYTNTDGYVFISSFYHPQKDIRGYVKEERLVMEKKLGRFLFKKEVVHHINGIKNDNNIKNLMLFPDNSSHLKYESFINGNPMKGKKHSAESRVKMKVSRPTIIGKNNPNYRNGKFCKKL